MIIAVAAAAYMASGVALVVATLVNHPQLHPQQVVPVDNPIIRNALYLAAVSIITLFWFPALIWALLRQ